MDQYRNATAIITGGASGIGRALGEALAERGAHVYLADVDADGAREAARAIAESGGSASGVHVDVRDAGAVQDVVDRAVAERGRIDYMFNNAGVVVIAEARDMTLDDWSFVLDVNVRGVIHGVQAAYPVMCRQGSGHIVNTSSVAGLMPVPAISAYVMSKHAVVGLTQSLRFEAEQYGVGVTVVCPGVIDTPMPGKARVRGFDRDQALGTLPVSGYPVARCAQDVLRGVARNAGMVVVAPHGKLAAGMYRYAPELYNLLARRSTRRGLANKG